MQQEEEGDVVVEEGEEACLKAKPNVDNLGLK